MAPIRAFSRHDAARLTPSKALRHQSFQDTDAMSTHPDDPYKLLGVKPSATDAEIKKAYRALAKKLHPDLHPGDTKNEERFKAVSAAYSLLGNAEHRRRFDAGEIDATGTEKPPRGFYRDQAAGGQANRYQSAGDFDDLGDIFSRAFGARGGMGGGAEGQRMQMRGADAQYHLEISFLDAVNGAKRSVTMPDGHSLDISIPAGIDAGKTLRLAGRGQPGFNGGPAGDALIHITVTPHPVFERVGADILLELPISLDEAVLGGTVEVPTPSGRVNLRIPPGSSSGRVMRLRGKGVAAKGRAAGDQLVTLKIMLPVSIDPDLATAIEAWRAAHPHDARKGWKGEP